MNMKTAIVSVCVAVLSLAFAAGVGAKESPEYRAEADNYYLEQNFTQAYRIYYKLAKQGDHYSQGRLSSMYSNGEGKKTDLAEAYAWAVLAAEGGDESWLIASAELLQQAGDKTLAKKKADKLVQKYGVQAQAERARKIENRGKAKDFSTCVGSRMNCRGR